MADTLIERAMAVKAKQHPKALITPEELDLYMALVTGRIQLNQARRVLPQPRSISYLQAWFRRCTHAAIAAGRLQVVG